MKLSPEDKAKDVEHGRVIARAMNEANIQKEKNMASAAKRKETTLRNAAERMFNSNY